MTDPIRTALRGAALLHEPALNKGTAFSREERRALGLEALLPWQVETIEQQVQRCWSAFAGLGSPLERYAWVQILRERNLTLFHRFLAEHIEAVRQALRLWLQQQQPGHRAVFGLWRDRPEEALDMQQALREEWGER